MSIRYEYPNFSQALLSIIGDKNPNLATDDNKKYAYQLQLANFRMGVDLYELNRAKDGAVYFTVATMLGFKTICETHSDYHYQDMTIQDWQNTILDITFSHFEKEEYQALKRGYVKKKGSGCLGMMVFIPLLIGVVMFNM